eukprot:TRINITY_DN38633_c0_g1_i1.p1 TRINITY_DN38633_c0_g1~~TRINITY_DN38633_c0_g1_i1.p1  ORF type:complete len:189 (+),score=41.73 TRINITY_DN38633_c0_g1_i1:88-654(+)
MLRSLVGSEMCIRDRYPEAGNDPLQHENRKTGFAFQKAHVAMVIVPAGVCLAVATLIGAILNDKYFGTVGTGGSTHFAKGSTIQVNALQAACVTALLASAMGVVRFGLKVYGYPRAYATYAFITYSGLIITLLTMLYTGTDLTPVLTSGAVELAAQVSKVLGGNFNYADEPFATTFADISSAGDVYNW